MSEKPLIPTINLSSLAPIKVTCLSGKPKITLLEPQASFSSSEKVLKPVLMSSEAACKDSIAANSQPRDRDQRPYEKMSNHDGWS